MHGHIHDFVLISLIYKYLRIDLLYMATISTLFYIIGDAGDSLVGWHNGMYFSTKDTENDQDPTRVCAMMFQGAWWYNACHQANLNGRYLSGPHVTLADGVNWYYWKGYHYSLKKTEMKIRPCSF